MHPDQKIRVKLRELMDTTELDTQVRVAQASGVAQSSINRILNQNQSPTLAMIAKLAEAFNFEEAEFMLMARMEVELLSNFRRMTESEQRRLLEVVRAVSKNSKKRKKTTDAGDQNTGDQNVDESQAQKISPLRTDKLVVKSVPKKGVSLTPPTLHPTPGKEKTFGR